MKRRFVVENVEPKISRLDSEAVSINLHADDFNNEVELVITSRHTLAQLKKAIENAIGNS